MKAFLIITYLFAGQFPAKTVIEFPDMTICQQAKNYLEPKSPSQYQSKLKCVTERTA